jgi:Na+/proline symporter
MCMQCMAGAMTAVGAASGTRAYLGSRAFGWLTARRLRFLTIALAVAAVVASATLLGGPGAAPR